MAKNMLEQKNYSHRDRDRVKKQGGSLFSQAMPLPEGCFARELKEMPDHSNFATRAVEARMGPFNFDDDDADSSVTVQDKGPFEMSNGAIYHG